MTLDEQRWHEDRLRHRWSLPRKAMWPLRLPVIRHIRAVITGWRAESYAAAWSSVGIGAGVSGYDRWVMYAIARGWC